MHCDSDIAKHQSLIEQLSLIDNPIDWYQNINISELKKEEKKHIYELALHQWIKRKIFDGSLLLHPDIREELIQRKYNPSSIHKKMIWASLLASYEGNDSREYFQQVKKKIVKKYGNKWWLDVYKRIKPTYAARKRLLEQTSSTGAAFKYAASQSIFLRNTLYESRDDALRMIPKE
ncbi:hypothetical protein [Pectobacterium versatile]|uniref:hypothetical protein n=1 Tax=Pectobacterium versatile TaxID=2488639 RepID=UPI00381DF3A1